MITDVEYMQIVSEAYDLSDYATKKKVLFCNEAKRVGNIEHVVANLYTHIKSNITAIDFGTIPKSRGVVTRIENYENLCECINSVTELVSTYSERTDVVDEVDTALANVRERERIFTKAFALNIEFPIMVYNMTVLSIVSSVSLLLAGTIEYVKNGHDSFKVSFDKAGYAKSREHVMYEYLVQFNRNCNNGTLDKLLSECVKNNLTPVTEAEIEEGLSAIMEADGGNDDYKGINLKDIVGTAAAVVGGVKAGKSQIVADIAKKLWNTKIGKFVSIVIAISATIIIFLKLFKKLAFTVMYMKMKASDWFELQAQYLQINAENLKYRDDNNDHRREVYQRQMKWVDRFKKIANALAIQDSKARKAADEDERASRNQRYEDDEDDEGGLF